MNRYKVQFDALEWQELLPNGVEVKNGRDRTCPCSQCIGDGIGYSGNSFWVTMILQSWFVGTWGAQKYKMPDARNVSAFCIAWLSRYPDDVKTDFDDDVKIKYGLT